MITVGYGDISPQNEVEIILCIFMMLIACGVFAFSINSISKILNEFWKNDEEIMNNVIIIN